MFLLYIFDQINAALDAGKTLECCINQYNQ